MNPNNQYVPEWMRKNRRLPKKVYLNAGNINFKLIVDPSKHGNMRRRTKGNLRDAVLTMYEERMLFMKEQAKCMRKLNNRLIR